MRWSNPVKGEVRRQLSCKSTSIDGAVLKWGFRRRFCAVGLERSELFGATVVFSMRVSWEDRDPRGFFEKRYKLNGKD